MAKVKNRAESAFKVRENLSGKPCNRIAKATGNSDKACMDRYLKSKADQERKRNLASLEQALKDEVNAEKAARREKAAARKQAEEERKVKSMTRVITDQKKLRRLRKSKALRIVDI